jgi:hypothetical protein
MSHLFLSQKIEDGNARPGPDASGVPMPTAAITTAFAAPGLAIAGTRTSRAVTAASVEEQVVNKQLGVAPSPIPPQSSYASKDADISMAVIVVPTVVVAVCLVPPPSHDTPDRNSELTEIYDFESHLRF